MSQSSETSTPVRVAVVGGGVAGVLLSIGLSKNPHLQVSLYEASRGFSQYGAGLNLGHNGVRALEAIDPKCFQGYKQHETTGILPGHKQVYQRLSEATGPNAGQVFLEVTSDIGQSTVHRARFLEEMVTLLPAGIAEFGKCLKHIENRGVDGVTLKFEDGTTADHDVLLGADGPNSGTRIHILGADHPAAHPVYSGMCDFRNLLPMDRALEAVGEELAKSKMIECGHGGYALHYPISHGEIVNVGLVTYHYKEWKGPWRRSATKDEMLKVFDGWGGNVEALIKESITASHTCRRNTNCKRKDPLIVRTSPGLRQTHSLGRRRLPPSAHLLQIPRGRPRRRRALLHPPPRPRSEPSHRRRSCPRPPLPARQSASTNHPGLGGIRRGTAAAHTERRYHQQGSGIVVQLPAPGGGGRCGESCGAH